MPSTDLIDVLGHDGRPHRARLIALTNTFAVLAFVDAWDQAAYHDDYGRQKGKARTIYTEAFYSCIIRKDQ